MFSMMLMTCDCTDYCPIAYLHSTVFYMISHIAGEILPDLQSMQLCYLLGFNAVLAGKLEKDSRFCNEWKGNKAVFLTVV
jgi:hypothetical protein